jgi:hypothetical protein
MTVALVALSVALGGTATAAKSLISGRQIKDGSIRRADLAKSAVDTTRVADGSLRGSDFDAATQASLAQAGTQVKEAFRANGPDDVPDNEEKVVATLSELPPGAYAIFAKTVLTGKSAGGIVNQGESLSGACTLDVDGDIDKSYTLLGGPGSNAPSAINMQITHTYAGPGTAKLACRVAGGTWRASNTSIIALRVSAPSKQSVDGR